MADPYAGVSTRLTPQNRPIPGRTDQIRNAAGGYVFKVDDEQRLRRFLLLGSDGATYYASAGELTRENADVVFAMANTQHGTLRRVLLEVSESGAAPRQNATLFALAIACSVGTDSERGAALAMLPKVARTGTQLFLFAKYVEQFRGWGRALRTAVARWYTTKDVDSLAYQAVKYQQRDGWSHRDLLRLSHPELGTAGWDNTESRESLWVRKALFDWICGRKPGKTPEAFPAKLPAVVRAHKKVQADPSKAEKLIRKGSNLSWEMLPDEALGDPKVWDALLDHGMPVGALIRQLPRLTRLGLIGPMGAGRTDDIAAMLTDPLRLKKARIHPINLLIAHRTYGSGASERGSSEWRAEPRIIDALDEAFYLAFNAVEPTGKRIMQCLDVSGSMAMSNISNMPLTPREASAALALVGTAVEPNVMSVGFTSLNGQVPRTMADVQAGAQLMNLPFSRRQRLDDAVRLVTNLPFGATDCSVPMQVAQASSLEIDLFVVYTDNETGTGWGARNVQPAQALAEYRRVSGINAKLVVVGMTATGASIADPKDPGMLDVVGFDPAVPRLVSEFARG